MVNAKFEEKGLECRIDHRSYDRQGLDLLPTVHEGVAVRQMEAKGITTDKGDWNRWVKAARKICAGLPGLPVLEILRRPGRGDGGVGGVCPLYSGIDGLFTGAAD